MHLHVYIQLYIYMYAKGMCSIYNSTSPLSNAALYDIIFWILFSPHQKNTLAFPPGVLPGSPRLLRHCAAVVAFLRAARAVARVAIVTLATEDRGRVAVALLGVPLAVCVSEFGREDGCLFSAWTGRRTWTRTHRFFLERD